MSRLSVGGCKYQCPRVTHFLPLPRVHSHLDEGVSGALVSDCPAGSRFGLTLEDGAENYRSFRIIFDSDHLSKPAFIRLKTTNCKNEHGLGLNKTKLILEVIL